MSEPIAVLKFGGTSVGSPDRLASAIELIAAERSRGPIAVVVSAMGDSTDWLIEAATLAARGERTNADKRARAVVELAIENTRTVGGRLGAKTDLAPLLSDIAAPLERLLEALSYLRETTAQSVDSIMSFGEQLSARVVTELAKARGIDAAFVDAREWMVTDATFGAAIVDWPATEKRIQDTWATVGERVAITTGFLGRTADGRTTTLGRNGSDYTAALLARGVRATELQIWTDVSGVMSADPGLVADARPLERLSYMEALELANFGARMFHPRTMIPLIEGEIPLRIRNTMRPSDVGTTVDAHGVGDHARPTSVTSLENLALVEVAYRRISMVHPLSGRVLTSLDRAGCTVWMATHSAHGQGVAVVVPAAHLERAVHAIEAELVLERARGDVDPPRVRTPVTLLTLVAEAMGKTPNVAGRFFSALGENGINVYASGQGASSRSISCAVDASDTSVAVQTVHTSFHLAHQRASVFLVGRGTVGGELLGQIERERERLDKAHGILLTVVGIADSRGTIVDARGVSRDAKTETGSLTDAMEKLRGLPVPILVDCTAADGMADVYEAAFERGFHVVAANKKPLAGPAVDYARLMHRARDHHRSYLYETTVGASLPVIETLKDLVRTGDEVALVEGSFSGTLGYLTNELMSGVPLSRAVATARELGYTEPSPQDDLAGLDVARKALILARELGLEVEASDVAVEPFVDRELLSIVDVGAFLRALAERDGAMADRIRRAQEANSVLRYLARIELGGGEDKRAPRMTVGPVIVDRAHPAAALRGSEAFVAFSTGRYAAYPLIVRGAGARWRGHGCGGSLRHPQGRAAREGSLTMSDDERLCGSCAAFMRVRTDERLGRVGECALEVFAPPVRDNWTCTRYRPKGASHAAERPRAAGEPRRRTEGRSTAASTTETTRGSRAKEIDIDMDIDDFRKVLREVLADELGFVPADMAPKWQGGEVIIKPGREGTQDKHIPIEVFFKKIVMVRDKLRLLEAKVNAHPGLSDEDKLILTSYVTASYGSLTTLNLLFQNKDDQFAGASGKE